VFRQAAVGCEVEPVSVGIRQKGIFLRCEVEEVVRACGMIRCIGIAEVERALGGEAITLAEKIKGIRFGAG